MACRSQGPLIYSDEAERQAGMSVYMYDFPMEIYEFTGMLKNHYNI